MSRNTDIQHDDRWIISARGKKNQVDPYKPYGWLVEKERTISGSVEDTGIIFLTNRECPFHCLMCDLWKNTTDATLPVGAIPAQIEWALGHMPPSRHLKLYNSGSFFDKKAILPEDYSKIASLVSGFQTVIVESHPKLISEKVLGFRDMLKPDLHVAMGLETVNPEILRRLNKQMTLDDFARSAKFLKTNGIMSRAFVLLRPPFMSEEEGVYLAEKSLDFAFSEGIECVTVIPVRGGNGAMDILKEQGLFSPPSVSSLEKVLEYGIGLGSGRVFADLWDLELFSDCNICIEKRTGRLKEMNLTQRVIPKEKCICNT